MKFDFEYNRWKLINCLNLEAAREWKRERQSDPQKNETGWFWIRIRNRNRWLSEVRNIKTKQKKRGAGSHALCIYSILVKNVTLKTTNIHAYDDITLFLLCCMEGRASRSSNCRWGPFPLSSLHTVQLTDWQTVLCPLL